MGYRCGALGSSTEWSTLARASAHCLVLLAALAAACGESRRSESDDVPGASGAGATSGEGGAPTGGAGGDPSGTGGAGRAGVGGEAGVGVMGGAGVGGAPVVAGAGAGGTGADSGEAGAGGAGAGGADAGAAGSGGAGTGGAGAGGATGAGSGGGGGVAGAPGCNGGAPCPSDMVCVPGTGCVHCGEPGEPCCGIPTSPAITPMFVCNRGCCVVANFGNSRRSCIDVDATCPYDGGTCGENGACSACGQLGDVCCGTATGMVWCLQPNTTCIDRVSCERCGGLGEPCCRRSDLSFPTVSCDSPLRCSSSGCGPVN